MRKFSTRESEDFQQMSIGEMSAFNIVSYSLQIESIMDKVYVKLISKHAGECE
jgi:hypothetical protein